MPNYDFLEPEFTQPWEEWKKAPNPANSSTLLKTVDPVINAALRTYAGPNPSPTIRSRAKLLTLHAAGSYDPNRAKLRSYKDCGGMLRGKAWPSPSRNRWR
jgi:hypothetical protein